MTRMSAASETPFPLRVMQTEQSCSTASTATIMATALLVTPHLATVTSCPRPSLVSQFCYSRSSRISFLPPPAQEPATTTTILVTMILTLTSQSCYYDCWHSYSCWPAIANTNTTTEEELTVTAHVIVATTLALLLLLPHAKTPYIFQDRHGCPCIQIIELADSYSVLAG